MFIGVMSMLTRTYDAGRESDERQTSAKSASIVRISVRARLFFCIGKTGFFEERLKKNGIRNMRRNGL
jgi:hypothetical protein